MSFKITDECINCGACQPECPNTAIYPSGEDYELNGKTNPALSQDFSYVVPEKCTECVGFHDGPQCASVCPTDACVKDKEDHLIAGDGELPFEEVLLMLDGYGYKGYCSVELFDEYRTDPILYNLKAIRKIRVALQAAGLRQG